MHKRETITFPGRNPAFMGDLHKDRVRRARIDVQAELYLPINQAWPCPAMVIIEGLGGLIDAREPAYGRWLADRGIATLVVDSFGTRNADDKSHAMRALLVTESMMLADAFAGLDYLREHPAIDGDRVGLMGFSYGGMVSVLAAYRQVRDLCAHDDGAFAAHVSYYGCSVPRLDEPAATGAPVLIMTGELDRNISLERSKEIADDLARGGAPVTFHAFPGTHHQWDTPRKTVRRVPQSLIDLTMRLDAKGTIRDGRTGLPIQNRITRALSIVLGADFDGYTSIPDEAAAAQSDEMLLDFLADALDVRAEPPAPATRPALPAGAPRARAAAGQGRMPG